MVTTAIEESITDTTQTTLDDATSADERDAVQVSFSHFQLYVDRVENLEEYKVLEASLNDFHHQSTALKMEEEEYSAQSTHQKLSTQQQQRELWHSITTDTDTDTTTKVANTKEVEDTLFVPQKRDVVKQLMCGLGFRVTGYRFPNKEEKKANSANTRSLLVTSKDASGVQIIVSAIDDDNVVKEEQDASDNYQHFDAGNLHQFFDHHANRQGIAVLGFVVNNIKTIYERYQLLHPDLIHNYREYKKDGIKVLEVFAYYQDHESHAPKKETKKQRDIGTILRFIETEHPSSFCILPGLKKVEASFDQSSQPAYCDHWVSNVFSRTEFLSTLEDTLGFTPKVDFNAGVVAAGEAQIESTVTGNESRFRAMDRDSILKDQSQVYLPINNALSNVGHVHGFLQEIGQGIQHVASRVEDLVQFIQRCNEMRDITGEGFTFLNIPKSYYGVLTVKYFVESVNVSKEFADSILNICEKAENNIMSSDGAVDLDLNKLDLGRMLDAAISKDDSEVYNAKRDKILTTILQSRYRNIYTLLQENVSEETYLGIVRNKILCDVQGDDILYQIFTSNILQRESGEEAPFFEFIQRVCSKSNGGGGCSLKIKPGCGGFGIRNFLTLFLSIEVSKAMMELSDAKCRGDENGRIKAQKQVDGFTNQLNDSNPILSKISDAMTTEGVCKEQMEVAQSQGDNETYLLWQAKRETANKSKTEGNVELMECSAHYKKLLRSIREGSS